jgi:hypothetical protein
VNTILVRVQLKPTSQPINHMAVTTYEKGGFYCLLRSDDTVVKYPLADIWRVIEDYGFHLGDNDPKKDVGPKVEAPERVYEEVAPDTFKDVTFAEKAVNEDSEGWAGSFGPAVPVTGDGTDGD